MRDYLGLEYGSLSTRSILETKSCLNTLIGEFIQSIQVEGRLSRFTAYHGFLYTADDEQTEFLVTETWLGRIEYYIF